MKRMRPNVYLIRHFPATSLSSKSQICSSLSSRCSKRPVNGCEIWPRRGRTGASASCVRRDRGSQQTAEGKRKWKHQRYRGRYARADARAHTHIHTLTPDVKRGSGTSTLSAAGWSKLSSLAAWSLRAFGCCLCGLLPRFDARGCAPVPVRQCGL